jgi:HK97 family phage portal protein
MALWDRLAHLLALNPQVDQERSLILASPFDDFPDLNTQLANIRGQGTQPWRRASVSTALGVPANFRAVTLIATTTGALSMNGYRNGSILPPDDRPRLIVRPDPFRTPRDFFRDTAWNMATLGEAWWWIAKRDTDGTPLSLINVDPQRITVENNPRDSLRPVVTWGGTVMPRDDMRQITFVQLPGQLRGIGPLQLCGAAVSVGVEAQEWAANFFAEGGNPSLLIKKAGMLSGELDDNGMSEADLFLTQWMNKPHNEPRLVDEGVEDVKELNYNTQGAQMLASREYQNGDAARMFGIPGSLLEYNTPGASLTYQNLEQEFTKFVRGCLLPYFLEPIEQHMSDLLTRSTVARFNVDGLMRADIKTRFESYKLGVESGVLTPEDAQKAEGIIAGDVETASMPFAQPQAIPTSLPIQLRSTQEFRCDGVIAIRGLMRTCNAKLADSDTFTGTCRRCKKEYLAA